MLGFEISRPWNLKGGVISQSGLLAVTEAKRVVQVLGIGRVLSLANATEVALVVLDGLLAEVAMVRRQVESALVLLVNGLRAALCEGFAIEILCLKARDEALVAWDVLSLKVLGGATDPVGAEAGGIAKLNDFPLLISGRLVRVESSPGVRDRPTVSHVGALSGVSAHAERAASRLDDYPVGLSRSAPEYFYLLRHMTSVAGKVLFSKIDLCHLLNVYNCLFILFNMETQC